MLIHLSMYLFIGIYTACVSYHRNLNIGEAKLSEDTPGLHHKISVFSDPDPGKS